MAVTLEDECVVEASGMYPSLDLAYSIAVSSYDAAIRRFDAMDTKLNTLATFGVTVSLAIPVLASNKGLGFSSIWFLIAACAFIAGVSLITYARLTGSLWLLDPMTLHNDYITDQPPDFKRYIVYWAGKHFNRNMDVIDRNGNLAAWSAMAFAVEAVAVGAWVVAHAP
jgi:hypothetical protein